MVLSTPAALVPLLAALATGGLVPLAAPSVPAESQSHAAPVTSPRTASYEGTWSWPLRPLPTVTRRFERPPTAYAAGHRGLDLAANPGAVVSAVDAGVVTHAGSIAGRGTVTITHDSGLRSTYEPVRASVAAGDRVGVGESVGVVAGVSHCGARCLHLGAPLGEDYLDPRPLLRGGPIILLPLT